MRCLGSSVVLIDHHGNRDVNHRRLYCLLRIEGLTIAERLVAALELPLRLSKISERRRLLREAWLRTSTLA